MIFTSKETDYKQIFFGYVLSGVFAALCGGIVSAIALSPFPIFFQVGIVVFILTAFVFFTNPLFAMMMFIFVRPSLEGLINTQIVAGVPAVGVFALLIIILLIFKFLCDRSYTIAIPNIGLLVFLLPISIFSMFNSIDKVESIGYLLRFLGWLSIYIFIFNLVKTKDDARKVMIALILSSIIPFLVGYYQLFTNTGRIYEAKGLIRVTSTFSSEPDPCATYFSYVFFVMLYFFISTGHLLIRRALALAMLLTFVLIIYTYHRVSWIGLMVGISAISIFNKKLIKFAIPFFILGGIVFHAEIAKRVMEFFEPPPTPYAMNSLTSRFNLWKISLFTLIPQHPFLGFGIGTAGEALEKYHGSKNIPHNDFIRLSVEMGIFCTILYVIFLIKEIRYYFSKIITKTNRELNVVVLAMFIFFTISSFAQNMFYNVINMTIFTAMLAVSKKMNLIEMCNSNAKTKT